MENEGGGAGSSSVGQGRRHEWQFPEHCLSQCSDLVAWKTNLYRKRRPVGHFCKGANRSAYDWRAEYRHRYPAVTGAWKGQLAIKLHRGKHMSGGPRMVRNCICYGCPAGSFEIHVPQLFCPVCSPWITVCLRVRTGGRLFPNLTGRKFTARLFGTARRTGCAKAERLGTHILRRGAA